MQARPSDAAATPAPGDGPCAWLGRRGAGPRLELVPGAGEGEPFVVLDDGGRFSRLLLARVVMGGDTVLKHVAWKMQRDTYPPSLDAASRTRWTNRDIEAMWRRERADLARARSPHVVALLDGSEEAAPSPPLWACSHVGAFFHAPCPSGGGLLRTCRDDDLLREAGLHEWSGSTQRYLCRAGAADLTATTFYQRQQPGAGTVLRAAVSLRSGTELVDDWGGLLAGAEAKSLPCAGCAHRAECWQEKDGATVPTRARERLQPLSFHDFHHLLLEALPLGFAEYCELAGGVPWAKLKAKATGPGRRGRQVLLDGLDQRFDRGAWLLRRAGGPARNALEVLRLRLAAWLQLAQGLADVHRTCRRPHLGVHGDNVMVDLAGLDPTAPALWGARVRLLDLGSAHLFVPPDRTAVDVPERFVPGSEARGRLQSPWIARLDHVPCLEVATDWPERGGDDGTVRFTARLGADAEPVQDFAPGDLARFVPHRSGSEWVWGKVAAVEAAAVVVDARLGKAHPARAWPAKRLDGRLELFQQPGPPCDLFGLGMLLLRVLLANDGRRGDEVERAVRLVLDRMNLEVEVRNNSSREFCCFLVEQEMRQRGDVYAAENLLHEGRERGDGVPDFPARLWHDVLLFGFRLVSTQPQFGRCSGHALPPDEEPDSLLAAVVGDAAELLRRVDVELLHAAGRDVEVGLACAELLAVARQDELGGGEGDER